MNSNSNYPMHKEKYMEKRDQDYHCRHPRSNRVLFESNYGNLGPLNVTFTEDTPLQTFNQTIARVSLDTSCLNCADIIIDFTGILNVSTIVSANSALTFTLFKTCDGFRSRQVVSSFNFFVSDVTIILTASHTLAFKFPLKNEVCDTCCTYSLELTSISNLDLGLVTYSINGTMSALAVES